MTQAFERIRILWEIYRPVRGLLGLYVLVVVCGAAIEGLMLMAIVPLVGGNAGTVGGWFEAMLDLVGADLTDRSLVFFVAFLVVLLSLTRYASALLAGLMVRRQAVRLQLDLFRAYLWVDWQVAVKLTQGELQLLLGSQASRTADFLGQFVLLLESMVYVVALTVAALLVSPTDTLLAVGLIGATGAVVGVLGNRIQRYADKALHEAKQQSTALLQFARGASVLRSFQVTERAVEMVDKQAQRREELNFRGQRATALAVAIPDLLFVLALLLVVLLAFQSGRGIEQVSAIIALLYRISQYLKRVSSLTALRERLPDVRDVYRHQRLFEERRTRASSRVDATLAEGSLVLEDLEFRYDEAAEPAVTGVNELIAAGSFVGIVGSSGGGKSTLAHLMVGLLEPSNGRVLVGADQAGEASLAFVPQSPFLLKGTVRENIAWFRDIDDERILMAVHQAGLDPVLGRLGAGLDSDIAQEGLTLSGGERQRLALARALAGSPRILVLDEATSALDSESERVIQQTLESLRHRATIVAVAHRLSTVLSCDRILVMEHGRVVESGAPGELLRRPDGRFASLSAMQGIARSSDPS